MQANHVRPSPITPTVITGNSTAKARQIVSYRPALRISSICTPSYLT